MSSQYIANYNNALMRNDTHNDDAEVFIFYAYPFSQNQIREILKY